MSWQIDDYISAETFCLLTFHVLLEDKSGYSLNKEKELNDEKGIPSHQDMISADAQKLRSDSDRDISLPPSREKLIMTHITVPIATLHREYLFHITFTCTTRSYRSMLLVQHQ